MSVNQRDLNEISSEVHVPPEKEHDERPPANTEDEINQLFRMSGICIWIDKYDDIFSEFDPRPYSQRALSDDFLKEAKYASREKTSGRIELVFLIPAENRIPELEAVIRKRLHEHFRKHANILEKEVKDIRLQGTRMSLCGFILLAASSYIIWKSQQSYWSSLLRVLTEPSGWFLSWEGLNLVVFSSKEKIADLEFYRKMAGSDIKFNSLTCQVDEKS